MKVFLKTLFAITLVILVWFVPNNMYAAVDVEDYVSLEELPTGQTVFEESGVGIGNYFTRVYYFAMTAAVFLAVLMLVIAGIEYTASGAGVDAKTTAKKRATLAIGGLILIFSSWLLLRTINPDLVNLNLTLPPAGNVAFRGGGDSRDDTVLQTDWMTINKNTDPWSLGTGYKTQTECEENKPEGSEDCKRGGVVYLDLVMRRRINSAGISINRSRMCESSTDTRCTTVAYLPNTVISNLQKLKEACGCSITITGGTETAGHATHGPGKAVVDLRQTDTLNSYLIANGDVNIGGGFDGNSNKVIDKTVVRNLTRGVGGQYRYEKTGTFGSSADHWHVTF